MSLVDGSGTKEITLCVERTRTLSAANRAQVDRVFETSCEQPNYEYLD
jgi:hypothetical protein